jgi:hypothetical protein
LARLPTSGGTATSLRNTKNDTIEVNYSGDTWAHFRDLKMYLEMLFRTRDIYKDDEMKVLTAIRGLTGRARSEWTKY